MITWILAYLAGGWATILVAAAADKGKEEWKMEWFLCVYALWPALWVFEVGKSAVNLGHRLQR